jgi:hypothetical protein
MISPARLLAWAERLEANQSYSDRVHEVARELREAAGEEERRATISPSPCPSCGSYVLCNGRCGCARRAGEDARERDATAQRAASGTNLSPAEAPCEPALASDPKCPSSAAPASSAPRRARKTQSYDPLRLTAPLVVGQVGSDVGRASAE